MSEKVVERVVSRFEMPKAEEDTGMLYHFTLTENKESILREGLLADKTFDGLYLCDSLDGVLEFAKNSFKAKISKMITVFEIDEKMVELFHVKLEKSSDHNSEIIKSNSFITQNNIPNVCIRQYIDYSLG